MNVCKSGNRGLLLYWFWFDIIWLQFSELWKSGCWAWVADLDSSRFLCWWWRSKPKCKRKSIMDLDQSSLIPIVICDYVSVSHVIAGWVFNPVKEHVVFQQQLGNNVKWGCEVYVSSHLNGADYYIHPSLFVCLLKMPAVYSQCNVSKLYKFSISKQQ
jgi:hypothetical protein